MLRFCCGLVLATLGSLCGEVHAAESAGEQSPPNARAGQPGVVVEQPRPFGYVVGDLLTQKVLLNDFEPEELPVSRRVGVWFERRSAKIERSADGRRWLVIEYQIINAPRSLTSVNIPAWDLTSKSDQKSGQRKLTIAAWPVSIAALTPEYAFSTDGQGELRADRPAPLAPTEPIRRQLVLWLTAFVLVLAAWFAWLQWRNWRATLSQPFARAVREMRSLDGSAPQTWQALHRAFDRTAGRVLHPDTLSSLFSTAPHFEPRRVDIERFFKQSSERFFGQGSQASPVSVHALCLELRQIEKAHER